MCQRAHRYLQLVASELAGERDHCLHGVVINQISDQKCRASGGTAAFRGSSQIAAGNPPQGPRRKRVFVPAVDSFSPTSGTRVNSAHQSPADAKADTYGHAFREPKLCAFENKRKIQRRDTMPPPRYPISPAFRRNVVALLRGGDLRQERVVDDDRCPEREVRNQEQRAAQQIADLGRVNISSRCAMRPYRP